MKKIIAVFLFFMGGLLMAENIFISQNTLSIKKDRWVVCTSEIVGYEGEILMSYPPKIHGRYVYNLKVFNTYHEAVNFLGINEGFIFHVDKSFFNKKVFKDVERKQIDEVFSHTEIEEVK